MRQRLASPPAEAELEGLSSARSSLRSSNGRVKTPQRLGSPPAEEINQLEGLVPPSARRVKTPSRLGSPPVEELNQLEGLASLSARRVKTPSRLGSPPADEVAEPWETCPVGATFMVVQDMLALKYGLQLDEFDFASKAKVRVSPEDRFSPTRYVAALNSEPALKVKDASGEHLVQLKLSLTTVSTFAELQGFIRRWPGTSCALAAVALSGSSGGNVQLVAAFREAYGEAGVVAKTRAKSHGKIGPLHKFREEGFHGAVVLEPVIERLLKYELESNLMLELDIPDQSVEFDYKTVSQDVEALMASRTCSTLADMAPSASNEQQQSGATASCLLAKELMVRHSKVPDIQISGCRTLGGMLPACRRSMPTEHAVAAMEAVVAAMRRHASKFEVVEAACSAVAGATASWPDLQSAAATNGATEEITAAMRRYPSNPELQAMACGALAGLAANHLMNQSAIAGCRGIEAIAAAMSKFPAHVTLQTMGCGAFGNLAANNANNQAAIASAGGLQQVVAVMRSHAGAPAVITSALGALWCLMKRHPENLAAAGKLGAAELAVAAVQRHQNDRALRSMASGALQCLVPGLGDAMAGMQSSSSTAPPVPGQVPRAAWPSAEQKLAPSSRHQQG
eukprot:TRINITY_DN10658_c0_g3_i1.p1 TRINITY_DN10658_c0_g3~~TRINITY_DN10658_c0_g3_i1.p1  ORF type:complete len:624 (+),score=147.40 TRINITY_DN10658_c0_g3_i1:60-1931(+)